jgi:hypothetical protein
MKQVINIFIIHVVERAGITHRIREALSQLNNFRLAEK